jgi:7-keto-8-aminopelargonate synthetase-like enzyme
MGQHERVLSAMVDTIRSCGAGAGGTRNISGTTRFHANLERQLARLHMHESALLFSSGYVANEAALATLGRILPNVHFFSDELNHASMIAGINHSKARKSVFRHNDVAHLNDLLSQADPDSPKVIVYESVYSMVSRPIIVLRSLMVGMIGWGHCRYRSDMRRSRCTWSAHVHRRSARCWTIWRAWRRNRPA